MATADPSCLWLDIERRRVCFGDRVLPLSPAEFNVLQALVEARGRVVPRAELARLAGLAAASPRRCDGLLVGIRRALGGEVVRNVRGRGWMLPPASVSAQPL